MNAVKQPNNFSLLTDPKDYFSEVVDSAFVARKISSSAFNNTLIKNYLVSLLEFYLSTQNLFDSEKVDENGNKKPQTLAELYLIALNSDSAQKIDLLKKLADRALYISGFFGDSLSGKIIDVDYYAEMGEVAYYTLYSSINSHDPYKIIYKTFSSRFFEFMDVLSYISQSSMVTSDKNLLRLYDKYLQTGSDVAKEKLLELGILTIPVDPQKKNYKKTVT